MVRATRGKKVSVVSKMSMVRVISVNRVNYMLISKDKVSMDSALSMDTVYLESEKFNICYIHGHC